MTKSVKKKKPKSKSEDTSLLEEAEMMETSLADDIKEECDLSEEEMTSQSSRSEVKKVKLVGNENRQTE